jgi:hypothetical protein
MIEQIHTADFIYKDKEQSVAIGTTKIKNGSKFIIGGELSQLLLTLHQHFNWFQKLMWKWCFGVKVEDYNEE